MAVSRAHNVLQTSATFVFLAGMAALAYKLTRAWQDLVESSPFWVSAIVAAIIGGYVLADFVSGVVHFLGDTFLEEDTPILGPGFIHPFREHHVDQKAICTHGFFEVNGNNCLVSIPFIALAWFLVPFHPLLASLLFWFMLGIFATNQFHKWAHADHAPAFVRWLQRHSLILEPKHHARHHTPPFDTYFCITTGWLNRFLFRIGFFPALKRALGNVIPVSKTAS